MNLELDLLLPECCQALIAALLFVQSLFPGLRRFKVQYWLPYAALVGVVVSYLSIWDHGSMLQGAYLVDRLSQFFKMLISFGFAVAVLNASRQPTLDREKKPDYFLFMAISAWGLMILSSAVELITIYLALELSSYSLYALIALRDSERRAAEAAIKYIFFGAAATALALYGFSYILAAQHSSYLSALAVQSFSWANSPLAAVGMTLFMGGMFYKLAVFPFHFWAPDVYQGASNETATYVATLPKLGAMVVLIRLTSIVEPGVEIITVIAVLAALSMTYGNLAALAQKDLKRILGFSTVAHAGYMMVGLVAGTPEGLGASAYYSMAYMLMNFTCFWVISRVGADGRNLLLEDINGLYRRAPVLAFTLAVGAFALVGLPPTGGFMAKLLVLTSAWGHGYNWLVILACINTAISIYYYLNIVRHAYTKPEPDREPAVQAEPGFSAIWAGILAGLVILAGVLPNHIYDAVISAGYQLGY